MWWWYSYRFVVHKKRGDSVGIERKNIKRSFNYEMISTLDCHHFQFSNFVFLSTPQFTVEGKSNFTDCTESFSDRYGNNFYIVFMRTPNLISWMKQIWKFVYLFWHTRRRKRQIELRYTFATHIFMKATWTFFQSFRKQSLRHYLTCYTSEIFKAKS